MPTLERLPPDGWAEWWAENVTVLPNQTLDDWRALPEGTNAELVRGEIVMSLAPSVSHQVVVARLNAALYAYVEARGVGIVMTSPLDVRLSETDAYQPDIAFVSTERLGRLGEQEIDGAPDLVVEVLSPSTGYYDLTAKRKVYEEAGVREYWIADPVEKTVTVLALVEGRFETTADEVERGPVASAILDGFEVEASALFRRPGA